MANSIPAAFDKQRSNQERIENAEAQWFHCTGEIQVYRAGASTVSVLFPVFYTDKPRFSYGAELSPGDSYETGNMPTCSVVVLSWDQRLREDGTVVYAGATFCIVTSGQTEQSMIAHWHMEGIGLRSPSAPPDA